jgi:hypothetical protein
MPTMFWVAIFAASLLVAMAIPLVREQHAALMDVYAGLGPIFIPQLCVLLTSFLCRCA